MSIERSILQSTSFTSIWNVIQSKQLCLELDPACGYEKLTMQDSPSEFFDLMETSAHIYRLYGNRDLKQMGINEVENGEKVCALFRNFWYQLASELKNLNSCASITYRIIHAKRYVTLFSSMDPEWLDLWKNDTMLRPSLYILQPLQALKTAKKINQ